MARFDGRVVVDVVAGEAPRVLVEAFDGDGALVAEVPLVAVADLEPDADEDPDEQTKPVELGPVDLGPGKGLDEPVKE